MSNGPCYGGKEGGEGALLLDSDASHPHAEKEGEYLSYSPCLHPHELCLQTWRPSAVWLPAKLPPLAACLLSASPDRKARHLSGSAERSRFPFAMGPERHKRRSWLWGRGMSMGRTEPVGGSTGLHSW